MQADLPNEFCFVTTDLIIGGGGGGISERTVTDDRFKEFGAEPLAEGFGNVGVVGVKFTLMFDGIVVVVVNFISNLAQLCC